MRYKYYAQTEASLDQALLNLDQVDAECTYTPVPQEPEIPEQAEEQDSEVDDSEDIAVEEVAIEKILQ